LRWRLARQPGGQPVDEREAGFAILAVPGRLGQEHVERQALVRGDVGSVHGSHRGADGVVDVGGRRQLDRGLRTEVRAGVRQSDCAVGRTRISLSDTLRGGETAKAMIWATSSAEIAVAS
jgi:hypothetical protein